ncbi:MAG TPA: isoamylase early set domain-containing protein [Gemmatimonadaceae bacterium]|jgi:1,4-alpha-glucan branching enzyme|nr:isoamylase early set domain-containing protein [Gemmatimonadaceae bacterium]
MSPLVGAALAAGLVGIGVLFGVSTNRRDGRAPTEQPTAVAAKAQLPVHDTIHEVKFVVVAPQASHVALVGDFNNWNPSATPMTRTPTGGTWSVSVHLDPGRHVYAYVVDGKQWMADPSAPLAPEDGFGVPNSVVLVNRGAAL